MSPRRRTRIAARAKARPWVRLSDEQLLSKRFCDLRLSIRSSPLAAHVRRLYADLERRGIALRPHVWLSEERSEEHTSELQSPCNLVCRLLLEKKKISTDCVNPH